MCEADILGLVFQGIGVAAVVIFIGAVWLAWTLPPINLTNSDDKEG